METPYSNEWIENEHIYGITNKNTKILFISKDSGSNNNRFIQYEINVVYEYPLNSPNGDLISGLNIRSDEIDYFFNPSRIFQTDIDLETVSVRISKDFNDIKQCGTYHSEDISVSVEISSYSNYSHGSESPFSAQSKIYLEFDKAITLDEALKIITHHNRNLN